MNSFTLDSNGYAPTKPTHDPAGNLTEYPRYAGLERSGGYVAKYDAWNRLVEVQKHQDSPVTVATYAYDGLNRRVVKKVQNSPGLNMTYHYYYKAQRVIETRNGSDLTIKQYTWAPQSGGAGGYINELVQISVNDDPTDESEGDGTQGRCETRYWAGHGVNYNIAGILQDDGDLDGNRSRKSRSWGLIGRWERYGQGCPHCGA